MKITIIPSLFSAAITALFAYGLYAWCRVEDMRLLLTIVSSLGLLLTGIGVSSIHLPRYRSTVNVKVVSGVFWCIILGMNLIFCFSTHFSLPLYVILNGVVIIAWLSIVYGLIQAHPKA